MKMITSNIRVIMDQRGVTYARQEAAADLSSKTTRAWGSASATDGSRPWKTSRPRSRSRLKTFSIYDKQLLCLAVGRTICEQRERPGWSRNQFAAGAGVSASPIRCIETQGGNPIVVAFMALAEASCLAPDALIRQAMRQEAIQAVTAETD